MKYTVLVTCFDVSGDHNGADLINYALTHFPNCFSFYCIGGERIKQIHHPDVHLIADHTVESSIGIIEGLRYVYSTVKFFGWFKRYLRQNSVDLLFCIDGQGRNLILGKIAKRLGVKTAYYFPPHVSIIGKWNIKKMKWFDLVFNPFLADHLLYDNYKKSSHKSIYVGHPFQNFFSSNYRSIPLEKNYAQPIIGIFPGSRYQEIKNVTPIFLATVKVLQKIFPQYVWLLSLSHEKFRNLIEKEINKYQVNVEVIHDRSEAIMQSAYFVLACSGTTTLKCSFFGVPHFIAYQISWSTYLIAQFFIYTRFIGMVNIAVDYPVVNEFINHHLSVDALVKDTSRYLQDEELRNNKSKELIAACKKYFCNQEKINPYAIICQHIHNVLQTTDRSSSVY